ncbi:hypothetical protein ACP26L_36370 (plasmid) [Paenibacillus sp. S-38]|uniref:hypothetical protein n=1 Tax=Paenibacillus sp. S-38 TaxID=3416710 RepID=UPI003CF1D948
MSTPMSKEEAELKASIAMNQAALDRIRAEAAAEEEQPELKQSERIWFEDDEEVMLRNGKRYKIPPMTFGDTREFMQLLKSVNVNAIILNFAPGSGDQEKDLFYIIAMGLQSYPEIARRNEKGELIYDRNFIDRNVDLRIAKLILDTMMDLNGLKK